jgi:hypothetical protein
MIWASRRHDPPHPHLDLCRHNHGLFCDGVLCGALAMSALRKTSSGDAEQRRTEMYKPGDKVRILLGPYAKEIMTVRQCVGDEVWLTELPKRHVMSKGNIERVA